MRFRRRRRSVTEQASPWIPPWRPSLRPSLETPSMRRPLVPRRLAFLTLITVLATTTLTTTPAEAAENRWGIGAHFWKTVDDLAGDVGDDSFANIEDDGFAFVLSYQRVPRGLFRFELDLEVYGEGFGGSEDTAISPIAFILFGGEGLYAGAGVGLTFSDGFIDNVSDPYFVGRIGWDFALLPALSLDVNANYRSGAFSDLGTFDTDAVTLGAILRFSL